MTKKTSGLDSGGGLLRSLTLGVILIGLAQFSTGCAIMIRGTTSTLSIRSEPSGATVYIDGIRQTVPTPARVTLSRNRHDVGLEKNGYVGQQRVIDTRMYWPATPLIILDIVAFGQGVVPDLVGGGFLSLEPKEIHCQLVKTTAADLKVENHRIVRNRPRVPLGMGVIYVDHPGQLPGGAKLFVSIDSKVEASAARTSNDGEIVLTQEMPARFNVQPGKHVVVFRKLGVDEKLRKDILVDVNSVCYVRAMSTGTVMEVAGSPRVQWDLTVTNVSEMEVLADTDLYYLTHFQNATDGSLFSPPPRIQPIDMEGQP